MALEFDGQLQPILGGGDLALQLIRLKDIDLSDADEATTPADTDLLAIDHPHGGITSGNQSVTNKITAGNLKTYFQTGLQTTLAFGKSSGNALKSEETLVTGDILLMGTDHVQGLAPANFKTNLAILGLEGGIMSGDITMPNDGKVIFGDAGEYIKGDGTDLTIASSGDMVLDCDGGDVTIVDSGTATPTLTLSNTSDAYGTPPIISFLVNPNNNVGASGDDIGRIDFKGDDAGGNVTTYAQMLSEISTATDGSEGGKISLRVASHDAEMNNGLIIEDGSEEDEVDVTIGNGDNSLTIIKGKLAFGDSATSANIILSENNMVSDSANALVTQQSVKAYVDTNRRWSIETGGYRSNNNSSTTYYFQYRPNGEVWSNTDSSPTSLSYADSYASMLVAPYAGKVTKISVHGYASDTGTTDPVKFYVFKGTPAVGSYMVLTQIGATGAITPMAYRQFVENTTISSSNTFSQHDAIYVMYKKDSTSGNQDLYFSVTVSGEYTD
jgi:hypothetical protein